MLSMPQIEPVTGLSRDYKIVERLQQLELLLEGKRILAEMASDPANVISLAELKQKLATIIKTL